MDKIIVNGGRKLNGEITVQGAKNSVLPILVATLLVDGVSVIHNCPMLSDVDATIKILQYLGCKVSRENHTVTVDSTNVFRDDVPDNLMREMRSSVILVGSLIGKHHKAIFSYPGGCDIGSRPIDLHLKAFEKLGINKQEEYGKINCNTDKVIATEINLDFPSVGATENIILASVLGEGETKIINAAMEPEIVDLQEMLCKMGAKVNGAGTNIITIQGVKKLKKEVSYNIMSDRIEAGTLLCATAITGGNIKLNKVNPEHITPIVEKLIEMGCDIKIEKDTMIMKAPKKLKATSIRTMPYPGFPTDLQSIIVAPLCVASGTSIVVENIFENRYRYTQELERMGAKINIEGRTAIIKGVRKLYGTNVKAFDLRGGASVVLAGLVAKGKTEVDDIKYVLRGYENIDLKLNSLGANIQRK